MFAYEGKQIFKMPAEVSLKDANSKTFIQGPVCFQGIWSRIYLIIMWA